MQKQDSMKRRRHIGRQQAWEGCHRQSVESVSSANGWVKVESAGIIRESAFFYPSMLH